MKIKFSELENSARLRQRARKVIQCSTGTVLYKFDIGLYLSRNCSSVSLKWKGWNRVI
jgi:hypothetical protein